MTDDEIERLKVNKIPPARPRQDRTHLPMLGPRPVEVDPSLADVGEATYESDSPERLARVEPGELEREVYAALRTIFDPEIPVNIVELGLIYGLDVTHDGLVEVKMTLTAPACPVAGQLVTEVAQKAGRVPGVQRAHVVLVWDPPWTKDRMSDEALLELGLI
jgi:FeS assembly SUF system protein